jgi:hypothetical protein
MTAFAWNRSSTKTSLPTLPLLAIGWMIAVAILPSVLHGRLPMSQALFGAGDTIGDATMHVTSATIAVLDDGSDSMDDDSSDADLDAINDSASKVDPASDPMQGAGPLRVAHRRHASSRHAHHRTKSHRKLVRAHH